MKYKVRQIVKIILAGVIPVFFGWGLIIIVGPLSWPTYVISNYTVNLALLGISYFLSPLLTILLLDQLWYPIGDVLKSREIASPFTAVVLVSLIPLVLTLWGIFFEEQAFGNMLFGVFAISAKNIALLMGLEMYPSLMLFNGYIAYTAVVGTVFYLGYIGFPSKKICNTAYIAVLPTCFYNGMAAVAAYMGDEQLTAIEPFYSALRMACQITWPAMLVILLRQIRMSIREYRSKGAAPEIAKALYR